MEKQQNVEIFTLNVKYEHIDESYYTWGIPFCYGKNQCKN